MRSALHMSHAHYLLYGESQDMDVGHFFRLYALAAEISREESKKTS